MLKMVYARKGDTCTVIRFYPEIWLCVLCEPGEDRGKLEDVSSSLVEGN
jgi:hypothetical protein